MQDFCNYPLIFFAVDITVRCTFTILNWYSRYKYYGALHPNKATEWRNLCRNL